MSDQTSSTSDSSAWGDRLEDILEAFEIVWNRDGEAILEDFFPSSSHPEHDAILAELFCVDLERRYKAGRPKSLTDYTRQYPELLQREGILERLAFEEYRLFCSAGSAASPAEYSRRLGIRTEQWPRFTSSLDDTELVARNALKSGVAGEMERIATSHGALPEVGEQFLSFEIVERLGACKFGSVYLAKQRELAERHVVIKVTSNLWCESDRLARLQHTNIVPIYSVHQDGGLQAVCMPFLGRTTLASLLQSRQQTPPSSSAGLLDSWLAATPDVSGDDRRTPPQKHVNFLKSLSFEQLCVWMVSEIAAGLAHAHDRGILHRDLKPANILLTDDGQPMILDFNLSADAAAGGRASLLIGGTLPYMAPEHLRAVIVDGHVDERSDIYSLGVMLFQLLTGDLPFPIQSASIIGNLNVLMNDGSDRVRNFKAHRRVSADVESILQRCLASRPDDRYQTAHELKQDLDRHLRDLPLRFAPNRSLRQRTSKWLRRHPRTTSASMIGTVCLGVLVIMSSFLILRDRELARHRAGEVYRQYRDVAQQAVAELSVPFTDDEIRELGFATARQALSAYSAMESGWQESDEFRGLKPTQRQELLSSLRDLQYLIASALRKRAGFEDQESRRITLEEALLHNRLGRELSGLRPSPALLLQHADLEAELGNGTVVDSLRSTLSQLVDHDRNARMLVAMDLMRTKDFTSAVEVLEQLGPPTDFLGWLVLGHVRFGLGQLPQADACFTSSVALWPECYIPYYYRALCRMKMGRHAEAQEDFSEVIRQRPDYAAALVNRALCRIERHDFLGGIEDLTMAMKRGRDDSYVYFLRANAWDALGDGVQARRDRDLGCAQTPSNVPGWIQRALCRRHEDAEAALADLDQALVLDPSSRQALHNKVAILSQLNRNQEALETMSRLLQVDPDDASILLGRGLLLARLGDWEHAVADGFSALSLKDNPSQQYQMSRIFAQTSQWNPDDAKRAVACLRKSLSRDPKLVRLIGRDPDLAPVKGLPEFQELCRAAEILLGGLP